MTRYRIGVDVGGTFTDFVMADLDSARVDYHKEPSVPDDPALAVERGVAALLERTGARGRAVELVVHGTTLALNAIIQGKGAAVALVVSRGNRDVMEIARARMPSSYDFTATRLLALSATIRAQTRRRIIEAVVPGIERVGRVELQDLITDPAAQRARLQELIDDLPNP